MANIIGIDFGTTNSCVAVLKDGVPTIVPGADGARMTPSVVAYDQKTGERLIGQAAKRQAITNPEKTVFGIKRDIANGQKFAIDDKKYSPQEIAAIILQNKDYTPQEVAAMVLQNKEYSSQEIAAMILEKLKADAEAYLGTTVSEAVVSVPACFTSAQRQAIKDAGKIAGLELVRIINEPTAAALAYGMGKEDDQTVMVLDIGGGTFDVSLLEISEGVFEVLATAGNNRLGGDDFDARIVDWMAETFMKENNGIDLRQDKMALQRLKDAAEKAKIELSEATSTQINLPSIAADATGPKHLDVTLTRAKLDELILDLVITLLESVRQVLQDADYSLSDISEFLLVGGASRIPVVKEVVKSFMGKEPFKGINPDECVALGAAIYAGMLGDFDLFASFFGGAKHLLLLDVTPLSLGIETMGGVCTKMIERNTTIPVRKSQIFSTAVDNQPAVDIHVLQGEQEKAVDNISLGHFCLDGIPPAPRGVPQIEVVFSINNDGIVSVSASEKGEGRELKVSQQF